MYKVHLKDLGIYNYHNEESEVYNYTANYIKKYLVKVRLF